MAYSPAQREKIFTAIVKRIQNGEALRVILDDIEIPIDQNTFYRWCDKDADFRERYTRATDIRADRLFEEIIEIADDSSQDELITEKGISFNHEFAARSKIRIDARKFMIAKMRPSKYGDKLDVTSGGDKVGQVTIFQLPDNGRE
jgi:hypothetical protein